MYGALDISTSALVANRVRLATIAGNIANRDAIVGPDGAHEPYRRRFVVLAPGDPESGTPLGVHVRSVELDTSDFRLKHEPGSPYADADGFVAYPNVNPVVEQMNAMEATRSYEANIAVIEATKSMMSVALQLLA